MNDVRYEVNHNSTDITGLTAKAPLECLQFPAFVTESDELKGFTEQDIDDIIQFCHDAWYYSGKNLLEKELNEAYEELGVTIEFEPGIVLVKHSMWPDTKMAMAVGKINEVIEGVSVKVCEKIKGYIELFKLFRSYQRITNELNRRS